MIGRIAVLLVALVPAGCGMLPIGGAGDLDTTTTGSIAPAPTPQRPSPPAAAPAILEALEPTDWERIRDRAPAIAEAANGKPLEWSNPETGSNGTIAAIAAPRAGEDGSSCRAFSLEVSDIRGVRRYRGDACRLPEGHWQLVDVTPEDRALL